MEKEGPVATSFADRLIFAIKRKGWNRNELTKAADLPSGAVYRWVRGQRCENITMPMLVRVAAALDISLDWLMTGREPIARPQTHAPIANTPEPPKTGRRVRSA